MRGQTLVYINSKGQSSKTGRLAPSQYRWLKQMSQKERGKWMDIVYEKKLDQPRRKPIYDEEFKDPTNINLEECSDDCVDIEDVIHREMEELNAHWRD